VTPYCLVSVDAHAFLRLNRTWNVNRPFAEASPFAHKPRLYFFGPNAVLGRDRFLSGRVVGYTQVVPKRGCGKSGAGQIIGYPGRI